MHKLPSLAAAVLILASASAFAQTAAKHSPPAKPAPAKQAPAKQAPAKAAPGKTPAKPASAVKPPVQLGVTTASGLTYIVTTKGTGRKPKTGETVVVHYTGALTDGTKFDSSHDRNEPIAFPIGTGAVIKGWDEGIAKLGVGDRAVLVIPPALGYGPRGAGGVFPAERNAGVRRRTGRHQGGGALACPREDAR